MLNNINDDPEPILLKPLSIEEIKEAILGVFWRNCGRPMCFSEVRRKTLEILDGYVIGEDKFRSILKELIEEKRIRVLRDRRGYLYYIDCEDSDG